MIRRRLNKLFLLGLWFLLAANLWHWSLHSSTRLSASWVDGIHGLLIGISIGSMLFGMARISRRDCAQNES